MENLAKIKQDWKPLCADSDSIIPTVQPVVRMEHRKTKEHAYFDVRQERFLTQQEAFDYLRGYNRSNN